MGNRKNGLKKLSLSKESLRRLVDNDLAEVAGGAGCPTKAWSGCSTGTQVKCACVGGGATETTYLCATKVSCIGC